MENQKVENLIIGAGPSGLSAAHELTKNKKEVLIIEKNNDLGGLARSININNNIYDIGPHRFFTKNKEINELFMEILGTDAVKVSRLTRILYKNKFFDYPLTPLNALFGLGVIESFRILISYFNSRIKRLFRFEIKNFEDWVVDKFGKRMYENFFKNYTEKVWGIPCDKIGKDWAEQRIKGLSLSSAVIYSLFPNSTKRPKSLVNFFYFPRLGAGQMWEKLGTRVKNAGANIVVGSEVVKVTKNPEGEFLVTFITNNVEHKIICKNLYFSCPIKSFFQMTDFGIPQNVISATQNLRYRDHIAVHLYLNKKLFNDNWIYIHSPEINIARIADFTNFSQDVSSGDGYPLTIEYFTFENDQIAKMNNDELIKLAFEEIKKIEAFDIAGLKILSSGVTRSAKAYPVIEDGYQKNVDILKEYLNNFDNLIAIGRSGMFKYNNQDHAMATGIYAVRSQLGLGNYDPWLVNTEGQYHEEIQG